MGKTWVQSSSQWLRNSVTLTIKCSKFWSTKTARLRLPTYDPNSNTTIRITLEFYIKQVRSRIVRSTNRGNVVRFAYPMGQHQHWKQPVCAIPTTIELTVFGRLTKIMWLEDTLHRSWQERQVEQSGSGDDYGPIPSLLRMKLPLFFSENLKSMTWKSAIFFTLKMEEKK